MTLETIGSYMVHYRDEGPKDGPAVLFSNALGTDLSVWDDVVARLPESLRIIRYDTRGHGQSAAPEGPYYMGDLVHEAADLLTHLGVRDCVVVGLSMGGAIAQGLAAERLDLVRAMVLSNTAAKFGVPAIWQDRIAAVQKGGIDAVADATLEKWLARDTRSGAPELVARIREMLVSQPAQGYIGCCEALAETDLLESTPRLKLPTLGIAGSEDGSTPPDLVRETTDLVAGSRFELIRRTGHLSCAEKPDDYAAILIRFLEDIGHL